MSKPKHTPGPWKFIGEVSEVRTVTPDPTSQYGNGTPIVSFSEWDLNSKEKQANARLIAAAPELLDALRAVRSSLPLTVDPTPLEIQINAAIAKATGGE